jgi:hypothetical protein
LLIQLELALIVVIMQAVAVQEYMLTELPQMVDLAVAEKVLLKTLLVHQEQ